MRRFRNPQGEHPYFYRPGFNIPPAGRMEESHPHHPHRKHFRRHLPNPYTDPHSGRVSFRPGLMGEPYGVYHTDAPSFYERPGIVPYPGVPPYMERRTYGYGIGDDSELNNFSGDYGGRGLYSPSENMSYVPYRFDPYHRPYIDNRFDFQDSRYREGWEGDTGYTSAIGGYNTGWDDDSWHLLDEEGESMGW